MATKQVFTLEEALAKIDELEASQKEAQKRAGALERRRRTMIQNNEAKLFAQRKLKEVEETYRAQLLRETAELRGEVNNLREQLVALRVESDLHEKRASKAEESLNAAHIEYDDERQRLHKEVTDLRRQMVPEADGAGGAEAPTQSSESLLRSVMTKPGASGQDLRAAIQGVEAMLEEARRELERKDFRERRGAFEKLHLAIEQAQEDILETAIEAAKAANVDAEDIEKADKKLLELKALSPEERAHREGRLKENELKKASFLLVKQKNLLGLGKLLTGLDENVKFEEWRDHNGRSLVDFAKFIGVCGIDEVVLQPQRMQQVTAEAENAAEESIVSAISEEKVEGTAETQKDAEEASHGYTKIQAISTTTATSAEEEEQAPMSAEEEADLKKKAFAAVVQGKNSELEAILKKVKHETWSRWENKGGKDLLTLSQERGRETATSILLKAMGIVKKREHSALEECQAVWIFESGNVQARWASVLEDTAANAEEVLIQFWDGSEGPLYVPRCTVHK